MSLYLRCVRECWTWLHLKKRCASFLAADFCRFQNTPLRYGYNFNYNSLLITVTFAKFHMKRNFLLIIYLSSQCRTQSFFGHTGTCTGTGTLTKVFESAPSDRQTDRQIGRQTDRPTTVMALFNCFSMPNN